MMISFSKEEWDASDELMKWIYFDDEGDTKIKDEAPDYLKKIFFNIKNKIGKFYE